MTHSVNLSNLVANTTTHTWNRHCDLKLNAQTQKQLLFLSLGKEFFGPIVGSHCEIFNLFGCNLRN